MNNGYDSWWLEEVKEHYKLYKHLSTLFLLSITAHIIYAATIGSEKCFENIPFEFTIFYYTVTCLFTILLWYMGTNFNESCLKLAFLKGEFFNFCFCAASYTVAKDQVIILCIASTVHTLAFQLGFIKDLRFAFVILIKHHFAWYTYRIFSGEIPAHFPTTHTGHLSVLICVMVVEFLKRKNRFEAYQIRKKFEYTQRNLQTILDSFPDGLIVLNNSLSIVYKNHKILKILNCCNESLLNSLTSVSYSDDKRNYLRETDSNLLIRDIEKRIHMKAEEECILGLSEISNQIYK